MTALDILFLGDARRAEFREPRAALEAFGPVTDFADADVAASALARGIPADVLVIAEARPSQFAHEAIDRLMHLAPLARVIALAGSWCEGEMRTGKPWPAAIRLYWHQGSVRCHRELRRLLDGGSAWRLPVTATDEERLLATAEHLLPRRHGLIAIHSRRSEMEDWLSAACRACGYATAWLRPPRAARVQGAVAGIFDATDARAEELDELRQFCVRLAPAPVVVLMDFPRVEDRNRVLTAGAAALLAKPLLVDDLLGQLDALIGQ